IQHLNKNDVTIEKFVSYVQGKKLEMVEAEKVATANLQKQRDKWTLRALKCPACATPMNVSPVNTSPGDQTEDDSKSVWMCPKCWHEEYSTKSIKEWLEEIRR
ncbi:MAG: hypothetical protein ABIB71_07930, partial [Candidatus Woesearchaeota archaeon]